MPQTTLDDMLTGLTPDERADRKAEALAALLNAGEYRVGTKWVRIQQFTTFTRNGVTIDLVSASYRDGCFALVLDVSDASGPLPMPDYAAGEAYLFRNPPVRRFTRAPDPDVEGDPGETVEDIAAVLQGIVYDAVVTYARNRGWDG